jgi:hypothetical protein
VSFLGCFGLCEFQVLSLLLKTQWQAKPIQPTATLPLDGMHFSFFLQMCSTKQIKTGCKQTD